MWIIDSFFRSQSTGVGRRPVRTEVVAGLRTRPSSASAPAVGRDASATSTGSPVKRQLRREVFSRGLLKAVNRAVVMPLGPAGPVVKSEPHRPPAVAPSFLTRDSNRRPLPACRPLRQRGQQPLLQMPSRLHRQLLRQASGLLRGQTLPQWRHLQGIRGRLPV